MPKGVYPRSGEPLPPERYQAVKLGELYRGLNIVARRIAKAQGRGLKPRTEDVAEATELRARIAALKTGKEEREV